MSKIFLIFLLSVNSAATRAWAGLEVYLDGEKPGLAVPAAIDPKAPLELEFARDEVETITIRIADVSPRKYVPLDDVKLKMRGSLGTEVDIKSYVGGTHLFAKSSADRKASGEVVDPLIPNELVQRPGFKTPVANIPSHPIYTFDLHVSPKARAGTFEGSLEFSYRDREDPYSIPLKIKVHKYTLPKRLELRSSFGFAPWGVLQKHYGAWSPEEMKLYKQYWGLASDHRIDLHKIYLQIPKGTGDLLTSGSVHEQSFEGVWEQVSSGNVGSYGYRWSTTDLPVPEEMKFPPNEGPGFQAARAYWEALDHSVLNHGLEKDAFVYFVDEPKAGVFDKLAAALKLIRSWAPHLQFMSTVAYDKKLDGAFNLWVENLFLWELPKFPSPQLYRSRQIEKNEKVWMYVGCNSHGCDGPEDIKLPDLVIDRSAAYTLALPFMALRYQANGILYYDTVYGYNSQERDSPWKDQFAFTGYGEGNLFYPCTPALCGVEGQNVIPSLRMKNLRDGMEDSEVLIAARKSGAPVDDWLKSLIPSARNFPLQASQYARIKTKALEYLDNHTNQ